MPCRRSSRSLDAPRACPPLRSTPGGHGGAEACSQRQYSPGWTRREAAPLRGTAPSSAKRYAGTACCRRMPESAWYCSGRSPGRRPKLVVRRVGDAGVPRLFFGDIRRGLCTGTWVRGAETTGETADHGDSSTVDATVISRRYPATAVAASTATAEDVDANDPIIIVVCDICHVLARRLP